MIEFVWAAKLLQHAVMTISQPIRKWRDAFYMLLWE